MWHVVKVRDTKHNTCQYLIWKGDKTPEEVLRERNTTHFIVV